MGSGHHMFAKIFDLHPEVKGWTNINANSYQPHRLEPRNEIWRRAGAIDEMNWDGDYHVISISCRYTYNGKLIIPMYKEAIDKFLEKGFDVQIGIIGRDKNILALQQERLRGTTEIETFKEEMQYLTQLPHIFLSMELAALYKADYIRNIGALMGIPVNHQSSLCNTILDVNANKPYVSQIEEGYYDSAIAEFRRQVRRNTGNDEPI